MTDQVKVLIIDDDEGVREVLAVYLEQHGWLVHLAGTGAAGIALAESRHFDVALIDLQLPDTSGQEVLRRLKDHDPELVCGIITGNATLENAIETIQSGAADYFVKPLELRELIRRLEQALEKRNLQRQLAETASSLQRSNEFLQGVLDSMSEHISIIDLHTLEIVTANRAFLQEYGLTEEEARGRKCYQVTHGVDEDCEENGCQCPLRLEECRTRQCRVEHVHRDSSGKKKNVEVTTYPLRDTRGEVGQVVHIARDITEIRQAEIKLQKQHDNLLSLFRQVETAKLEWERTMDCMGEMIILTDGEGRIRRCNRAVLELLDVTFEEVINRSWEELLRSRDLLPDHLEPEGTELFHENSGRWFILRNYIFPVAGNEDGEGGRVITISETTRLRQIAGELECRNREIEQHRVTLKNALDEISRLIQQVVVEQDFSVRYSNPHLPFCYQVKRCTKKECPCFDAGASRCWQVAGTFCRSTAQGTFAQKLKDCTECEVYQQATADPIYLIGEQFNNMMHILESKNRELQSAYEKLKTSQSRILQQEKMASIGQLAAGVAHEINNPVGFVSSNLGTLDRYLERLFEFVNTQAELIDSLGSSERVTEIRDKLKIDYILEDARDLVRESLEGTDRVKTIVQNLKSFSRVDEAQRKLADINDCLETTLNIIWNELKYKATVIKRYNDLPSTLCYPQELNQVFMNLLVNAAHAIEKQGEIIITTSHDDNRILVAVEDNGCGIPPEKLDRVFEPFFTTKEVGAGTGLGLSIVYDIVKKHDGEITVESEPGRGTAFTVILPVIRPGGPADGGRDP